MTPVTVDQGIINCALILMDVCSSTNVWTCRGFGECWMTDIWHSLARNLNEAGTRRIISVLCLTSALVGQN